MKKGRPVGVTFILCGCFVGWACLGGGCAMIGKRLLLPGMQQGEQVSILPANPDYEIVTLRTKVGTKIVGQFGRARSRTRGSEYDPTHAPTVLFFYGKNQTLAAPHDQKVFNGLRDMGVNVFIPEFPGIGMSEGRTSESEYYATADAALDYLFGRPDIDHARIIAAGQSLGTGIAIDLASRRELAGLISVGGFTSPPDVLTGVVQWMPRWFARALTADCHFDNLTKMKAVKCPILLVYGTDDTVIPPWMADRLAGAAAGPVTKLPVPSSHNSLWNNARLGLNADVRDWMQAR